MTNTSASSTLPALYIGHGAPPLLDDPAWSSELAGWAQALPRPQAILIISAHWESAPVALSAPQAPLVYDFAGFDPKYFRVTYPTPDSSALADRVRALLPDTEPVHQHASRGLDHGAWVPLRLMYPEADIPVLQMSLPTHDPARLLELGSRLRSLRDEGVLVIGSGFLTHGLRYLRELRIDAPAPGWSQEFDTWAAEALARGDVDELSAYADRARDALRAPDGGAPLSTLRHPRERRRPHRAAAADHRRVLDGAREAILPGRLTRRGVTSSAPSTVYLGDGAPVAPIDHVPSGVPRGCPDGDRR